MASMQTPKWPGWQGAAPPLPTAPFPVNAGSFPFPPSPHPTVHTGDDDDATDLEDGSSEDGSYDGSDEEVEGPEKEHSTQGAGNLEAGTGSADDPARDRTAVVGPRKSPGQAASVDVLAEIRKMIKEECTVPSCHSSFCTRH